MKHSATERLRRFYKLFSGDDQVLIVINADPDPIASAMAVKRLLWRKVASVTISHINTIQRPDNLAMIRLLGVDAVHIKNIDETRFIPSPPTMKRLPDLRLMSSSTTTLIPASMLPWQISVLNTALQPVL